MDFLDPRKKRAYRIRLMVGYVLMAIAIGLGAVILVYGAYGYSLNTKTGQIVQNGLLFVGSQPGGADIYLNGKAQNATTAARLILPAGNYSLSLKRSGYHNWQRSFVLDEHTISRYVYPFLFPVKPLITPLKAYPDSSRLISQSPDRHWLLVESTSSPGIVSFDEYDTGKLIPLNKSIILPPALLTNTSLPGSSLSEVEWSSDNNHLLLKHTYQGGNEFIILDRADPANSINVDKLFNTAPTQVNLRNKKIDQLYIYSQTTATLQQGDTGKATLGPTLLSHVLAYKPYGNNLLSYVTDNKMPAGKAQARIWDSGKTYPLYTFNSGSVYLVDAAQFQGHWYYIAGSDTTEGVNLYKDPLDGLRDPAIAKALPFLSFKQLGASKVSFSTNARFIGVQSGQKLGVYDGETQTRYQYIVQVPFIAPLQWMDGHRWLGSSGGVVLAMDYDGTNRQLLVPTTDARGGYFSRDFNHLFVLAPPSGSGSSVEFQTVDMRAGADLPKTTP